ncbi:MAG: RNA polymerase sigma factor RpoD/SigA [Candidatus Ornithospirochaeta sp.]|nr:RNA polymerase sigma factor RpoD/SigA [Sphaerochaetaceae bacterium]MDY5523540.1 RNA polymerase sigma factor RpoD/SigA [Candidatus Ornithospirochaeta sp.]
MADNNALRYSDSDNEVLSTYLKAIDKIPLLTYEEEYDLALKAKNGDKKARERLINSNLRFVVSVAKKFRGQGIPLEDLINEGNIGLMTAVDKFEPEKGYHFISYAVWWVRQAILKALAEQSRPVRLPLNRSNELIQIVRAKNELLKSGENSDPSAEDIAEKTGLERNLVKSLMDITREMISFDSPIKGDEEGDSSYFDFVEDKSQTPEEDVVNHMMEKDVRSLLGVLGDKERDIIEKRYGFNGREPMSLKAIGDEYNLTKERIRQIEKSALEKLRNNGDSVGLEYYSQAM